MTHNDSARPGVSTMVAFFPALAGARKQFFAILAMVLVSLTCFAQGDPALPDEAGPAQAAPKEAATLTIPAGSRLALVLTSPIASKNVHRGDMIYAQMTAPVTVGNEVALPAGSFVQGTVEKLSRNGSRAEMLLQSVSVVFPDGYVANIAGPLRIESDEGTAWKMATKGGVIGLIAAPAIGGVSGALIGRASSSSGTTVNGVTFNPDRLQNTGIGSMAGLAAGTVVGFVLLSRSRRFYVEVGSPMANDAARGVDSVGR
jgi:type IV secretion system protein VirB10